MNIPLESWEQEQIFIWASMNESEYPQLKYIQGSLNGIKLPLGLAVKAKKQGLKRGWPDIDLPWKNKKYSGLHIELKRIEKSSVSKEQKETIKFLSDQGRFACICYGHSVAIEIIEKYLNNKL